MSPFLTPKEVATIYRVTAPTVREWIKKGRLRCDNIGTERSPRYLIRKEALTGLVVETTDVALDEVVEYI